MRSRFRLLLVAVAALVCAGAAPAFASHTGLPDLSGTWQIVENHGATQTDTLTRTGPGLYTYSNGLGWWTTNVPISGSSALIWICGNGGTYSQADQAACPVSTHGQWHEHWHFDTNVPPGHPYTARGDFKGVEADGSIAAQGTFTAVGPTPAPTQASLSVAVSAAKPTLAVGAETTVAVKVTAAGAAVSGISLGRGLVASSGAAVVSRPPGLSGFDLAAGASRSFEFKLKGAKTGTARLSVSADGKSAAGDAVHGSGSVTVKVVEGVLSVADVTRGTDALSADVRVKFEDPSTDASGCDPSASYDFTDPQLASAKAVGPCSYELRFQAPGTGIYHVELKATDSAGRATPVSVDQYGATVDGTFNLIIDSCSEPDDDLPDVDALLDASDGVCAVAVGDWDSDAADVASKVLAADESSPTLAIDPISVDSVDPSDWPGSRGLVLQGKTGDKGLVLKSTDTGWVPIGTKEPPDISASGKLEEDANGAVTGGDAAALIKRVKLPPLPVEWGGADCPNKPVSRDDRPSVVVISSHGLWYPPNGLIRVPAGDQISTYVPIGSAMSSECLGLDIDTGHVHGDDTRYLHVYTAGQLMPNFTFIHYDGGGQGKHVTNPTNPTTLSNLIKPGEGLIAIAACATLYIPAGGTLAQALSSVPVHTPGSNQSSGYKRVTITQQGEIQTSAASGNP